MAKKTVAAKKRNVKVDADYLLVFCRKDGF